MPEIIILQNAEPETPGLIADVLQSKGFTLRYVRTFAGEPVPLNMGDAAALVCMGGPQSVYEDDKFPYLRDVMRLMEDALTKKRPVLGVCLGSQLLAATLGVPVVAGPQKEIGFYPVYLTEAGKEDALFCGIGDSFTPVHWHGDVYPQLPCGATWLARSELTPHQAFRYGENAYGILFHLELTSDMLADWTTAFAQELQTVGIDGGKLLAQAQMDLPVANEKGKVVFEQWANRVHYAKFAAYSRHGHP
jgi:GMP synthase (glutamine-hydrolysing)